MDGEPGVRQGWTDGGRRRDIVEAICRGERTLTWRAAHVLKHDEASMLGRPVRLSIIVPACGEAATIGTALQEASKLGDCELLVVANGKVDETEAAAMTAGARVLTFEEALGTDVGRAIGAHGARGEVLLFVDGDFVIPAGELVPFVEAVYAGRCDVALNRRFVGRPPAGRRPGPVSRQQAALNQRLGRADLGAASMSAVPVALNRRALEAIGWPALLCPPLAQAKALAAGLRVEAVHALDVERLNRCRPEKHRPHRGRLSLAAMQIIGDHLEALAWLQQQERKGVRSFDT